MTLSLKQTDHLPWHQGIDEQITCDITSSCHMTMHCSFAVHHHPSSIFCRFMGGSEAATPCAAASSCGMWEVRQQDCNHTKDCNAVSAELVDI